MAESFNGVAIFSATKFKEREELGETINAWIKQHPNVSIPQDPPPPGYPPHSGVGILAEMTKGEHILVIEDCETVRDLMGDILGGAGYTCSLAPDGSSGLEMAQRKPPGLVLLDFIMPRMNGFQFMQAFRKVENQRDIPVVLVSVKADGMGEKFMRATGAVDALTKPFTMDSLVTVVQHALSRAKRKESSEAGSAKPFLGSDRYDRPTIPDMNAESSRALQGIRERLLHRVSETLAQSGPASSVDEILAQAFSDEFLGGLAADYASVDPSAGVASFAGSTDTVSVGEIMQLLLHGQLEGRLEIQGPGMLAHIYLRSGRVALARLSGGPDEFLLGRYLLKEDLVTREELRRILDNKEDKQPLGERLIRMGIISRDDLVAALTEQTTEVLFEVLRWHSSRYRYVSGPMPPDLAAIELRIPVGEALLEGLRRVDEWRMIEKQIPDFDVVPVRTAAGLEAMGPETSLSAEEARIFDFVNGARTVRQVIQESRLGSFEACKILYRLLTMKVIRKMVPA